MAVVAVIGGCCLLFVVCCVLCVVCCLMFVERLQRWSRKKQTGPRVPCGYFDYCVGVVLGIVVLVVRTVLVVLAVRVVLVVLVVGVGWCCWWLLVVTSCC